MKAPPCFRLSAAFFLASLAGPVCAQTVSIANWQGNKAGAISLTFDDSLPGQWLHADPVLASAGLRGTFYVITNTVDWNAARSAALNGHEIGSHSTVDATLQDDSNANLKMLQSHDAIEAQIGLAIPGYQCHSIAWPYGFRRLDVVNDAAYHGLYLAARNAGNAFLASNSYNAADTSAWWKFGEGNYALDHLFVVGDALIQSDTSLATINSQLDLVEAQNGWSVFTYHAIETGGYANIPVAVFSDQVSALAARQSTLYIAPFGEVIRYIRQRDAAVVQVVSHVDDTITISLTDNLPDDPFNLPLTLLLDRPAAWQALTANQAGQPVPAKIVGDQILLDAVPDAGSIVVSRSDPVTTEPPILEISPFPGEFFLLSWDSESGVSYEVLISPNLSTWQSFDPAIQVIGDGSRKEQSVPYSSSRQFFKLQITTP